MLFQFSLELVGEEKIQPLLFPTQLSSGFTHRLAILEHLNHDFKSLQRDKVIDHSPDNINVGRGTKDAVLLFARNCKLHASAPPTSPSLARSEKGRRTFLRSQLLH